MNDKKRAKKRASEEPLLSILSVIIALCCVLCAGHIAYIVYHYGYAAPAEQAIETPSEAVVRDTSPASGGVVVLEDPWTKPPATRAGAENASETETAQPSETTNESAQPSDAASESAQPSDATGGGTQSAGMTSESTQPSGAANESAQPSDAASGSAQPVTRSGPSKFPTANNPADYPAAPEVTYVLNSNPDRMRFHIPTCQHVSKIAAENRIDFTGTREQAIAQGYIPCAVCNP